MKAIFVKELRENLKWGLLILGFFTLSVAGWIHEASSHLMFDIIRPETTGLPFAIVGLAMGLLQTWFETRPDNFAFVVHRPISRLQVFIAKSAAGLLLIYVGLLIPAIYLIVWAATPGNLAMPFQWRSALPLAADILAVTPFYFTGMVLTLRKARWFGTRLLPLGLAAACTVAVRESPQFWQAICFAAAGSAVCALAAWNVFSTAGVDDRAGVPKFALGTMIYVGALAVGIAIVAIQGAFQNVTVWHDMRVDRAGNVLRVTWTIANKERSCVVADANGKPLPEYEGIDPDDKNDDNPNHADQFVRFVSGFIDESRAQIGWTYEAEYLGYRTVRPGVVDLRTVAKYGTRFRRNCLFDVPERIIEMYDPVTLTLLGTVGPAGYAAADKPPAERFPRAPLNPVVQNSTHTLSFPSEVYWMELDQHRVRKIFTATADDPIVAAAELPPQSDPTVVVVTQNRLHVMKPSGEALFSAEHDLDWARYWFSLALLPDNHHVMLCAVPIEIDPSDKRRVRFFEFDTDGKLARNAAGRNSLRSPPDRSPPHRHDGCVLSVGRAADFGAVGVGLHIRDGCPAKLVAIPRRNLRGGDRGCHCDARIGAAVWIQLDENHRLDDRQLADWTGRRGGDARLERLARAGNVRRLRPRALDGPPRLHALRGRAAAAGDRWPRDFRAGG